MLKIDKLQYVIMTQNGSLKRIGRSPSFLDLKKKFLMGGTLMIHMFCIITPNCMEIGRIVAEVSRFFRVFQVKCKNSLDDRT